MEAVAERIERTERTEATERLDRGGLERLDRDSLIARAEAAGVPRARILTRPELVDELLQRDARAAGRSSEATLRQRGFFGKARDLLARVVERGLNLPDAAERIRAAGAPPPPARTMASALPTVTLAELYATQGHKARAIETLRRVLDQEPEHATAQTLLAQLEEPTYKSPEPVLPPEPEIEAKDADADEGSAPTDETPVADADAETEEEVAAAAPEAPAEPFGMLDDAPLPYRYDVDECIALPVDPTTLFVYWEVRDRTREHLATQRSQGGVALRVLVIVPGWEGPRTETLDYPVGSTTGDWFVNDLPPGCVVRAAIGWKEHDVFLPIAHSPALETPPGAPSPVMADTLMHWTPQGVYKVTGSDPVGVSVSHAVDSLREHLEARGEDASGEEGSSADGADAGVPAWNPMFDGDVKNTPLGSSERMAKAPFSLGGGAFGVNSRGVKPVALPARSLGSSDRMLGSSDRLLAR